MGESLLLITIITLIVLTVRRARPVVLDNPVVIQRPGQYHITLAPKLNRAQTFIEGIARQFAQTHPPSGDLPEQYFEVRDPNVIVPGASGYLLAVALRAGVLHFQAVNPLALPHDGDSQYKALRTFSEAVLEKHPLSEPIDEQWSEKLREAVETTASQFKVDARILHETD